MKKIFAHGRRNGGDDLHARTDGDGGKRSSRTDGGTVEMICTHEQTAQDCGKQREPNNAKELCGGRNAATKNNTTIHHHTTTEINSNDEAQQRRRMQRSDGRDVTWQRRMQRKSEGNVEAAEGKNGILFLVQQKKWNL